MNNPFRSAPPPEDEVALYISPGHYQVSVWIVFGIKFVENKTSVEIRNQPFSSEVEAKQICMEWQKNKEYDKVYYKHCGVMDVSLPVNDKAEHIGKKSWRFW